MKTTTTLAAMAVSLVALALPAAAGPDAYTAMIDHYEAVRTALLHDTLDGVADAALGLESTAEGLAAAYSAESAGVPADAAADAKALLPEIAAQAEALVAAGDLETARQALGELTRPLVRYQKLSGRTEVLVAYCPMTKKSWLQKKDDETIGNPYFGQEMPGCGSFVGH